MAKHFHNGPIVHDHEGRGPQNYGPAKPAGICAFGRCQEAAVGGEFCAGHAVAVALDEVVAGVGVTSPVLGPLFDLGAGLINKVSRERVQRTVRRRPDGPRSAMQRLVESYGLAWSGKSPTTEDIRDFQKRMNLAFHPDRGGSHDVVAQINRDCETVIHMLKSTG